jgi:hypothetical protein
MDICLNFPEYTDPLPGVEVRKKTEKIDFSAMSPSGRCGFLDFHLT